MAHTPGPWYVRSTGKHWNNHELENLQICYGSVDECICDTVYEMDDAQLISTAPELLEALKKASQALRSVHVDLLANEFDALIAKATKV